MTVLEDHINYTISSSRSAELLLDWKPVDGLPAVEFAAGITSFAKHCSTTKPRRAVIDARRLDQSSEAAGWLRAQVDAEGLDSYHAWWESTILPRYNEAKIDALVVATGDPNAPGEIPSPDSASFAVGYFTGLEAARTWTPS